MKTQLACLSLAALAFTSCDKSGTKTNPDDTSSKEPQLKTRADRPDIAEKPASAPRAAPAANTIDPPISRPVDVSMIRPAGTTPEDASWETLTAGQKIEKFHSSGIAQMPKDVSDKIITDATNAVTPEEQLQFIIQQSAAWHHINQFKEDTSDIPDHMRMALLERLATKHGESWKDMVPELDEQVAASAQVMKLRMDGIPGMTADESQDFIINALEKYGPDYKTILSVANQSAGN
jgi:hypothetical protein